MMIYDGGRTKEGIVEEELLRRNHGGVMMGEESWKRNPGGGIMEDASWRRHHGGGHPGMTTRHPGTCRRHPGGTQEAPGGAQEASGRHPGGTHLRFSPLSRLSKRLINKLNNDRTIAIAIGCWL